MAAGQDPKGLIRDPDKNVRDALPIANRRTVAEGLPRAVLMQDPPWSKRAQEFIVADGQPAAVRAAPAQAMGTPAT